MKFCNKCGSEKPLIEFGKHSRCKDGLQQFCKECQRKYFASYRDKNREDERKRAAKWRNVNRDIARQRVAEWMAANPDKQRSCEIAYRKNNPEKRRASCSRYRSENREKERIYRIKYCALNKDRLALKSAARRAMKLIATPGWASEKVMLEIYRKAQEISEKTGSVHHVDHVVPLKSKLVCGLHCEANLDIIPGSENQSKLNRYWPDMP